MIAADAVVLWRYCWMLLLRGGLWAVLVAIVFAQPQIPLRAVSLLAGTVMVMEGVLNLLLVTVNGLKGRQARWGSFISIAVGVLAFWFRSITASHLLYYVACWALVTGIIEIIAAVLRGEALGTRFWSVFAGLATLAFGLSLLLRMRDSLRSAPGLIATCGVPFVIILFTLALGAYACMKVIEPQSTALSPMRPRHR